PRLRLVVVLVIVLLGLQVLLHRLERLDGPGEVHLGAVVVGLLELERDLARGFDAGALDVDRVRLPGVADRDRTLGQGDDRRARELPQGPLVEQAAQDPRAGTGLLARRLEGLLEARDLRQRAVVELDRERAAAQLAERSAHPPRTR